MCRRISHFQFTRSYYGITTVHIFKQIPAPPNHAVELTPLARPQPGRDSSGKARPPRSWCTFFPQPVGGGSPIASGQLVPTAGSFTMAASGAAHSSALGGHAILVGPSERVVRFRDHGLREGFRSVSPSCSHSWGAAHGLVRRDGGALVAPAPRRSPSSCSGRRGVNRALPAAPRAATTCRLTSAMQLTPLRGP
jgi:hypothetical protein